MSGSQEAAAVSVQVARVVERNAAPESTHLARVEAAERVEIRPRVGGQVIAVLFREGEMVSAGQALFKLDPRPFDIAVDKAEAELKLAAAREQLARQSHERAMALIVEEAIASEEKEQRESAHRQAAAQLASAKAALEAALLDREFATIRAPISGMVGRALVTQGHQVVGGPTQTPMAVLSSSVLHVHLDIPYDDAALAAGKGLALPIKAKLQTAGQDGLLGTATLDYRDPEVQSQTGSVRLRGRIDSDARMLTAGQHVLAILQHRNTQQTLWIPDKAVGTDQGLRFATAFRRLTLYQRRLYDDAFRLLDPRWRRDIVDAQHEVAALIYDRLRIGQSQEAIVEQVLVDCIDERSPYFDTARRAEGRRYGEAMIDNAVDVFNVLNASVEYCDETVRRLRQELAEGRLSEVPEVRLSAQDQQEFAAAAQGVRQAMARVRSEIESLKRFYSR